MLLIDAYNVLYTAGVLPPDLAGLDVPALARLIAASRYAGRAVRLVCDGGPALARERLAEADVLYAGPGREADDLIEQILRSDGGARSMLVVSSDRRIRRAAKRRRAVSLSSEAFLSHLAADAAARRTRALPAFVHDIPLDRTSVVYWMRELDVDESWIASLPVDSVPSAPPPASEDRPKPAAKTPKPPGAATSSPPRSSPPVPPRPPAAPAEDASATLDPILREALEVWRGRLTLDDLDMRRWLDPPFPSAPSPDAPPPSRSRRTPPRRPR